jgi:hypothetical protein
MTSRDGLHWDRRFMEAFLRPGLDPENWNERNMYAGVGIVPTGPAEMSIYYLEHFRHPSARLRRATLRADGIVSINAPYAGGELVTRPLTFGGDELAINYATSAAGSVRVELQDAEHRPLDGYGLADSVDPLCHAGRRSVRTPVFTGAVSRNVHVGLKEVMRTR